MDQQIIPMLSYENGVAAMEWLCDVLMALLRKQNGWMNPGKLTHGEIAMGDSIIMLATPTPDYQNPRYHRGSIAKATFKAYKGSLYYKRRFGVCG